MCTRSDEAHVLSSALGGREGFFYAARLIMLVPLLVFMLHGQSETMPSSVSLGKKWLTRVDNVCKPCCPVRVYNFIFSYNVENHCNYCVPLLVWCGPGNADDNDGDGVFVLIMTTRVPRTTMGPQHVRVLVYDRDGRPLSIPCYEHPFGSTCPLHISAHIRITFEVQNERLLSGLHFTIFNAILSPVCVRKRLRCFANCYGH